MKFYNKYHRSLRPRIVVVTSPPWGVFKEPHDTRLTPDQILVGARSHTLICISVATCTLMHTFIFGLCMCPHTRCDCMDDHTRCDERSHPV